MIKNTLMSATALFLIPHLASGQNFSGNYRAISSCSDRQTDDFLQIRGFIIEQHETTCQLRDPISVRDMGDATLFDSTCRGEGETWTERIMLMNSYDGLVVVREGSAVTFQRCR